jgi:hypothetical protein
VLMLPMTNARNRTLMKGFGLFLNCEYCRNALVTVLTNRVHFNASARIASK